MDIKEKLNIRSLLAFFIKAKGFDGYPQEMTATLQEFVKANFDEVADKLEKVQKQSFDGSNKATSKGQHIAYWAATSPELEKLKAEVMSNASPEAIQYLDPLHYGGPKVIADASDLTPDEWQAMRKNSIGSSAIAQVFGESPYPNCTNIDLYNQKTGQVPQMEESQEEKNKKELMFLWGHIMEEYLQKWVSLRWPGTELVIDTNIYAAPKNPFLTANLDGMLKLRDGTWIHIEFKTTSEFNDAAWANGGIPPHYKRQLIQCQHIMGVWKSRIIVAFSRDNVEVREYIRDLDAEMEQVEAGKNFWFTNVLANIPPVPLGPAKNIVDTVRKYSGYADKTAPEITLPDTMFGEVDKMNQIMRDISIKKKELEVLEREKERLMVPVVMQMQQGTKAYVSDGKKAYRIGWSPRAGKRKVAFEQLEEDYPSIYAQYVTKEKEAFRVFTLKETSVK